MDAGIMYLSYNNHVCMQYSFKDYYMVFLLFGNEQQKVFASYTYNVISEAFFIDVNRKRHEVCFTDATLHPNLRKIRVTTSTSDNGGTRGKNASSSF